MHTRRDHRSYPTRRHADCALGGSQLSTPGSQPAAQRPAFTLVELLVAITIFAILSTLALSAFRETDQDRAKASAQLLRSMIEGARSRAIHDQAPRGIRLILDPVVDPTTNRRRMVTSVVYIGAPEQFAGVLDDPDGDGRHTNQLDVSPRDGLIDQGLPNQGQPVFSEPGRPGFDDDNDGMVDNDEFEFGARNSDDAIVATVNNGTTPGFTTEWRIRENVVWPVLRRRKLLAHTGEFIGARIKIPARANVWFPIVDIDSPFGPMGTDPHPDSFPNDDPDPVVANAVRLTIAGEYPFVDPQQHNYGGGVTQERAKVNANTLIEYVLELAPPILPGTTPQALASGVAIDLDGSKIPPSWIQGTGYIDQLDILFSPRGEVIGSAAAAGVMHFVLAHTEDIVEAQLTATRSPNTNAVIPNPQKPERLVTLFTRTGQVTTSEVNRFGLYNNQPYDLALAGKDAP